MFLAKDVAEWIEHQDVTSMLRNIVADEKILRSLSGESPDAGNPYKWFLAEDGLYEVLMLSRKPIARQFKKQVKEILKTIRKTGGYVADDRELEFVEKYFPSFSEDVKLAMVQDLLNQNQRIQIENQRIQTERDEAERKRQEKSSTLLLPTI